MRTRPLLAVLIVALGLVGFTQDDRAGAEPRPQAEQWAVYEASTDISRIGLLVASTATVGDIRTCTLVGGGLCSGDPATDRTLSDVNLAMVLGPFPTQYEAAKAFCDNIIPDTVRSAPLSAMMLADMAFDGETHGISNAPSCPPATPRPPTPPAPTGPLPTDTPVPSPTPELGTCFIEGVVRDAGARPAASPARDGHPLIGAYMALVIPPNRELKLAATEEDGSYQLSVSDDDLPPGFDTTAEPVQVRLRLQESAHEPSRFAVLVRNRRTSLLSDPFFLADECDDGLVERNFLLGDIPSDYDAQWPLAPGWKHIGEIYDRIHRATELADLVKQPLDYELPLLICAFCTGVVTNKIDAAFWCGAKSHGGICSDDPFIGLGNGTSLLSDGGWPDNREYHEFGHHFLADSFNNAGPGDPDNRNHGGYYKNPSSTDSWSEGFAEFFSMMVSKHIDGEPMPYLYRLAGGAPENVELDYRPWYGLGWGEEFAVAGLLLDLEDGPEDYARGREAPNVRVAWHDFYDDPALGRLLVGEVVNDSPIGDAYEGIDYSEQTMIAAQFQDASGQEVFVGWASAIPWDLQAGGGRGFFSIVIPEDLVWDTVAVVAFEGRPGDVLTDDDPVDLTLQEVWDTIVLYTSLQTDSNGYLFDVADLHAAFRAGFGGRDVDGNGVDDIDQVFIAHGLFADTDGNRSFRNEEPGRTDHPDFLEFPAYVPRRDAPPAPGSMVEVNTGGLDARVLVQIALPEPNQFHGYSYLATPDEDSRVHVAMPPPEYGGSATLTVLAEGYLPAVAGVVETEAFWQQVEEEDGEPFLSFDVDLRQGEIGASDGDGPSLGWLLLAGGGGVLALGGLAAGFVAYRREGTS